MERVGFREWVLDADVHGTREAYARARTGGSEDCGCDPCRNFVAGRRAVFPQEVLDLFQQLGIDSTKEGEAYWTHRTNDGMHHYGGWFHFVGSVVSGPPAKIPMGGNVWEPRLLEVTPRFSLGFEPEADAPRLVSLRGTHAVQVEFQASLPWKCDRPETLE